jgi:hypothetical protein
MYVLEELNDNGEWEPAEGFHDGFYILQTFSDLQDAIDEYKRNSKTQSAGSPITSRSP